MRVKKGALDGLNKSPLLHRLRGHQFPSRSQGGLPFALIQSGLKYQSK